MWLQLTIHIFKFQSYSREEVTLKCKNILYANATRKNMWRFFQGKRPETLSEEVDFFKKEEKWQIVNGVHTSLHCAICAKVI